MKCSFFIFSLFIPLFLFATKEETIVVSLSHEHPLLPVYLAPFSSQDNTLTASYLESLREILVFDFNHNGMTKVTNRTPRLDSFARVGHFQTPTALMIWQQEGIYYVIDVEIAGNSMTAKLFTTANELTKSVGGVSLTGNLSQDRKQIHILADTIHKSLFQKEGIASTRFLYTQKQKDPQGKESYSIIEADYDGANPKTIIQKQQLLVSPSYVPAREGLVPSNCLYVSYELGQPKMFVSPLKGGSSQRLSFMKGNQLTPTIANDKTAIAFVSDIAGNPDLFLIDLEPSFAPKEKPRQIYSFPRATQASPVFSPDGKQIAFVSNKDGATRIYLISTPSPQDDLKKLKPKLLTTHTRESSAPSWSPDGTKLAFCAKGSDGVRQIWIYDFTKGEERQLTKGPGNKENPTFAKNSLHLIFNSTNLSGESELYLMNLHQPDVEKISSGPGEKRYPSWD